MMNLQRRRLLSAAAPAALLVGAALREAGAQAAQAAQASPAAPPEVAAALPGARLLGSGRLRVFGMRIYDARLWVGKQALPEDWTLAPNALEIVYGRKLEGRQIAERSIQEMRRQGVIASAVAERWLKHLIELIPDVGEGDRLTAVNQPGQALHLLSNGERRGEIAEADFARRFIGIWLAPQTSEPQLRAALLGKAGS